MFLKHSGKTLALFILLPVVGCSSTNGSSKGEGNLFSSTANTINIESDPSGADVYVMGEKIGVTPLKINHKDVFPNIYPKERESVYGRVTLKKAGCSDLTRTISMEIGDAGLHAKLECASLNPALATPRNSETVEQRLDKIKDLQSKGLITDDEAKKARERVLGDL